MPSTMYDQDLDKNAANYVPLSPISFLVRAARVYPDRVGIIHGDMKHGKFTMRHGLRDDVGALNKSDATPTASTPVASQHYQLDFDYYAENVELGDVEGCIKKFNATNFALFSWCLGDKSKALLGEGRPKK